MWLPGSADTVCPRPSVTLTFDRLNLKLVCESQLRWGNFILILGTVGLWVLELFAMRQTDRHTDGRMDKNNAYCPLPYGRGHNNIYVANCRQHQRQRVTSKCAAQRLVINDANRTLEVAVCNDKRRERYLYTSTGNDVSVYVKYSSRYAAFAPSARATFILHYQGII